MKGQALTFPLGGGFQTMSWSPPPFPDPDCMTLDYPVSTSYDDWIDDFTVGALSGVGDCPAGEGVPNLLKYALGLDPTASGRGCVPRPILTEYNNDDYLAVQFTRPDWTENVMHTLETSPDLFVWTQHHDAVVLMDPVANSSYEEVRMLDPEPADLLARRFLRLRTEVDTGIYVTTECEGEEGLLVKVDATKWQNDHPSFIVEQIYLQRSAKPAEDFEIIATDFSGNLNFQYVDREVSSGETWYYRAYLWYTDGAQSYQSPLSNLALQHVTCSLPAPELIASGRPDQIVLNWRAPEWARIANEIFIGTWTLMRSADPEEGFQEISLASSYNDLPGGLFVDTNVSGGTVYYYRVQFAYSINFQGAYESPRSPVVSASVSPPPPPGGPMDVAFVLDTSGSMTIPLNTLRAESYPGAEDGLIDKILDEIAAFSNNDYRLALVTSSGEDENGAPRNDIVHVRANFSNTRSDFREAFREMSLSGGGGSVEESTDECLNTVVNALTEADRQFPEEQYGDFDPPFDMSRNGSEVRKLVVLITQDLPGGFADSFGQEIWCNARSYTLDARDEDVRIAALQIGGAGWEWEDFTSLCPDPRDDGGDEDGVDLYSVMRFYAETTGGRHIIFTSTGAGLAEGISGALVYDELVISSE